MAGWIETPYQKFRKLSPAVRFFIQGGAVLFFVLFIPPGDRLLAPLVMLFFWTMLSAENRTVTVSSIVVALGTGMIFLIPAAMVIEVPLILILGKDSILASALSATLEAALITSLLVGLCLWPKSRLRYTGSIMDFSILGLGLGVGLEIGISVIHPGAGSFQGISLGIFPQLPGMIGHTQLAVACSSPAVWGLLFGTIIGIVRFLIGPDLNGYWARGIVISLGIFFLGWIFFERLAYNDGTPIGWLGKFFWFDLKGRLLAYLTGLTAMVTILVEWLLLQERPQATELKNGLKAYETAWSEGNKETLYSRMMHVIVLYEKRCLIREIIMAEEIKPVLCREDHEHLQNRIRQVEAMLTIRGG